MAAPVHVWRRYLNRSDISYGRLCPSAAWRVRLRILVSSDYKRLMMDVGHGNKPTFLLTTIPRHL